MSFTLYTSGALVKVIESLEGPPSTFVRDRFFREEIQSDKEEILFDVVDKKRRLAPYVSPLVRGKIVEARGYNTRMFKPAYVKPKAVVKPTDALRRTAGEPIGGTLSLAQRRDIHIRTHLQDQDEMISMREEVQAVEVIRMGRVTVTGEGYGTVVVNFGRDSQLRGTLSGTTFADMTIDEIFEWLEGKSALIRTLSGGAVPRDVICGTAAWAVIVKKIRANAALAQVLLSSQARAQTTAVQLGPSAAEKVVYQGTVGEFSFYTYSDTYQDEDGVEQQVFPAKELALVSQEMGGTRCYGAILDADAGLAPLRRFAKMWRDHDPSAEYVMTQSAPLMVPQLPNASGCWQVLP